VPRNAGNEKTVLGQENQEAYRAREGGGDSDLVGAQTVVLLGRKRKNLQGGEGRRHVEIVIETE